MDRDLIAVEQWTKQTQNHQLQIPPNQTFKKKNKRERDESKTNLKQINLKFLQDLIKLPNKEEIT